MSTRYVWERYNVVQEWQDAPGYISQKFDGVTYDIGRNFQDAFTGAGLALSPDFVVYYAIYRTMTSDGILTDLVETGGIRVPTLESTQSTAITTTYYLVLSASPIATGTDCVHPYEWFMGRTAAGVSGGTLSLRFALINGRATMFCANYRVKRGFVDKKGSMSYGRISNAASAAYPTDGVHTDGYWYVYQGSDSIIPTAVSYSTTTPRGGGDLTAILSPSQSNVYGGTIRYMYNLHIDGSWKEAMTTTATSYTFTVPTGSKTAQVIVLIVDDMGYRATDPVNGAILTVKNESVYAGVNGVVRSVSAAVAVGGVVKTNVSMYQGVNGVVKQS